MNPTENLDIPAFFLILNYFNFHYHRNSITCSTIHTSVNAGFGVYISKCLGRLFLAVPQASSYFDIFSQTSCRILIILRYLC